MASDNVVAVSDKTFHSEVLEARTPVLVDFWAPWCGPCRALAPIIDEIAKDYGGRVKVAKINVDENPETASNYGVRSIPTLLVLKDGKVVKTQVGSIPKSQVAALLESTSTDVSGPLAQHAHCGCHSC